MQAHTPAFIRFNHLAAQRLGNNLVSETNADKWNLLGRQLANKILQRRHPLKLIVNTVS
jgi:hypothetical protein